MAPITGTVMMLMAGTPLILKLRNMPEFTAGEDGVGQSQQRRGHGAEDDHGGDDLVFESGVDAGHDGAEHGEARQGEEIVHQ